MADEPAARDDKVVRTLVGTTVGAGGLALSLTLVYLNMRAVMSVGGSCASGGPFEIAQPCPRGTGWMTMVGVLGALVSTLVLALTAGRGPQLWTLAWSALFISLGWNFLDFGLDPPEVTTTGGWIFCGVLFWLMGGLPLLAILRWGGRATFWGTDWGLGGRSGGRRGGGGGGGAAGGGFTAAAVASTLKAAGPLLSKARVQQRADLATPPWVTTPASDPSVHIGLVAELERLAALHSDGKLTDAEFDAAKQTIVGGT